MRMAVKYYNKLFKEYCIADMSRYKTGQIGLRWRTQACAPASPPRKQQGAGEGRCEGPMLLSAHARMCSCEQKEVFSGAGQFRCGNQACSGASDLSSYEMNFVYKEHGERKEALVKLRLCPECGAACALVCLFSPSPLTSVSGVNL